MSRRLVTVTTKPAAEPLILNEAKEWLKITATDDDALITTLINAAVQAAEQYVKRSLITQTLKLTFDAPCNGLNDRLGDGVYDLPVSVLSGRLPKSIPLPRGPVQSITSVTTYDLTNTSAVYASSNYILSNDRLILNFGSIWPSNLRSTSACEIVYVTGYGNGSTDVPQPIKTAMLMHIEKMYYSRLVCDMPDGCVQLIRQYRVMDGLNG